MEAELKCQRTRDRQDSFALHIGHAMWIFQSPKTGATVLKAVGKFINVRHFGDMAFADPPYEHFLRHQDADVTGWANKKLPAALKFERLTFISRTYLWHLEHPKAPG